MHTRRALAAMAVATTVAALGAGTAFAAQSAPDITDQHGAAAHPLISGKPIVDAVRTVRGTGGTPRAAGATKAAPQATHYVSMAPVRSFDTRRPQDGGALVGGTTRYLTWKPGEINPRVRAVVANMTVTNATANTYVTAWDGTTPRPKAASINVRKGETRSIQVTIPIGHRKDGTAVAALYNNAGRADVITDLAGAYGIGPQSDGETFTGYSPLHDPSRVMDTRSAGPIGTGQTRTLDLADKVPADATAVTLNLTELSHGQGGYLALTPGGTPPNGISSLNYAAGSTTPNQVTVALSKNKTVDIYNHGGPADVLVDLAGSYSPQGTGLYYSANPTRVLDTRDGSGTSGLHGALGPDESVSVPFPGEANKVIAANTTLTGIGGNAPTYLTAWGGGSRPGVSNLNLAPGQIASNAAAVRLSNGQARVYNHAGTTNVVLDVSGYFAPAGAADS